MHCSPAWSPATCTSCPTGAHTDQTVTVAADGTVPDADPQTLGAGSYSYLAVYSGNANYNGKTGDCEPFTTLTVAVPCTDPIVARMVSVGVPVAGAVYNPPEVIVPALPVLLTGLLGRRARAYRATKV